MRLVDLLPQGNDFGIVGQQCELAGLGGERVAEYRSHDCNSDAGSDADGEDEMAQLHRLKEPV